jgi:tetratricopeptide (TPR) repeat protein
LADLDKFKHVNDTCRHLAARFFQWLDRNFPDDLDVLYLGTRIYSDLSTLTSQLLLRLAPNSYQTHRLSAEAFETEGQTADAIEEYRKILAAAPHLSGIHYRIGLLLLARDREAATLEEARHEFEMELEIAPGNADAEYQLAEMARAARQWDEAIRLFEQAVKWNPKFPDALVGLGKSLVSSGRAAEAVAALERAVKLAPNNPLAHYQLSFAHLRTGRDADAKRELALDRQVHERQQNIGLTIRQRLSESMVRPQTAEPPE